LNAEKGVAMRRIFIAIVLLCIGGVIIIAGCGSDDMSTGPQPVTGVSLDLDQINIEVGHSERITATVNGDNKNLTWYVNGIENGNEVVGEITHNSPATYTAPNWLPDPVTVVVKAVSVEDSTKYDSCMVTVTFDKRFVDPVSGNDANNGCINLPFKTLTYAFTDIDSGGTVVAQPGVYSETSGETFPLLCREPAVTIVGTDWEQCIIRGSSSGTYRAIVWLGSTHLAFRKFTLEQGPPGGTSNVMIVITGSNIHVDSIRVHERAGYAVCRGENTGGTNCLIENCYFVVDDGLTMDRGINLFNDSDGAIVRNCTLTGFDIGLRITNNCDVLVEGCIIEGNEEGIEVRLEDEPGSLNPDFGGGPRGSTGGNIIRDNTECGLSIELDNAIFAKFNIWTNDPPVVGTDYCVVGAGGVIVE
jgi:hypothetical protein